MKNRPSPAALKARFVRIRVLPTTFPRATSLVAQKVISPAGYDEKATMSTTTSQSPKFDALSVLVISTKKTSPLKMLATLDAKITKPALLTEVWEFNFGGFGQLPET